MSRERELLPCDEEMLAWALDAYESDASRQYRAQAYYFMRDDFLPHVRALLAEAPAPITPETHCADHKYEPCVPQCGRCHYLYPSSDIDCAWPCGLPEGSHNAYTPPLRAAQPKEEKPR